MECDQKGEKVYARLVITSVCVPFYEQNLVRSSVFYGVIKKAFYYVVKNKCLTNMIHFKQITVFICICK